MTTQQPWQDSTAIPEARARDLVGRLDLAEKVGLMFHPIIDVGADGRLVEDGLRMADASTTELVARRHITHFNVHQLPAPALMAEWVNRLQELARASGHGVPVTISSDPRHGFNENLGVSFTATGISQWPEAMAFAALDDPDLVRRFAEIARREYTALGIRAALHPQVDLVTEPRWGRQAQCLGQDPERVSRMVEAYLLGFQGEQLGPDSVACMTKHFPGGGPQLNGDDPHFVYGQEQVYPGGRFEQHLAPFKAAIAAGTSALMPYYGRPVALVRHGEPIDSVGFGFNRQIITGLLRDELGYDGVVCTDWALVSDSAPMGLPFPARAWGVEHLDAAERLVAVVEAGCDQFGGESCTDLMLQLVAQGRVSEQRIDESAVRLLKVKFALGLFDDPFVDPAVAEQVGEEAAIELGRQTQARSVVVLKNSAPAPGAEPVLPLQGGRLYLEGMAAEAVAGLAEVTDDPDDADLAIVRIGAGFEPRNHYFLEAMMHQGSLDLAPATVRHLLGLAEEVPVVLVVTLDRPAILTPVDEAMTAVVGEFGASDRAVVAALTGEVVPAGRLPFDLPRSMAAVEAGRPDVANDTDDPLYGAGHGLAIG